jgi:hypothetical protein
VTRAIRLIMLVAALGQILVAIGFFAQMPWIKTFWPFDYTEDLSFIFMASIAGAAAASTLWCLYVGEDASFAGIALDYAAIFGPLAVFSLQKYTTSMFPDSDLLPLIIGGIAGIIMGIALFIRYQRVPFRYTLPTPRPIRIAFGVFVVALILLGSALVLKTDGIMPWTLSNDASVIYGWFFIGAAIYFIYGLIRPVWGNAGSQLSGFLAYDLILIVPFVAHLSTVKPNLMINLIIYIVVLVGSGALAIYYLFINPATRLSRSPDKAKALPHMSEEPAI